MAPHAAPGAAPASRRRQLSVIAFIVVVLVYLAILQGLALLLTRGLDIAYAAPTDIDELWRMITVPVAFSVLFTTTVISYLRWWRPVAVDDRPVQRWIVIVPVFMVLSMVLVTNYGALADQGAGFTLLLLLSALLVGTGEELMFRGLGVATFRTNGFTEGKVALWSTVIFGVAHSTNLLTEGASALAQVLATIVAGYFFYLVRRRSGGIVVPAVLHGLWDFSLISNLVGDPGQPDPRAFFAILTMLVLVVVVLVRRRHIEPAAA